MAPEERGEERERWRQRVGENKKETRRQEFGMFVKLHTDIIRFINLNT